jgi:hypothetical protein
MKNLLTLCMVLALAAGCGPTQPTTGRLTISQGAYEGEIRSGKAYGQGSCTWPDGRNYVGQWKNNLPNGQGTMMKPDGTSQAGIWKKGVYVGPAPAR